MTEFKPIKAFHAVERIRAKVLFNRFYCETAFARDLHYNLLEKLDEMAADLLQEIEGRAEMRDERHVPEQNKAASELYYLRTPFEQRWIYNGLISVLDEIHVDIVAEGEGEVCRTTLDYTPVPAHELEGLIHPH